MRTQAQIYATNDAANSIQKVIAQLREAQLFALPVSAQTGQAETGWIMLAGTNQAQFNTTYNTEQINTAIELTAPPALTASANGYTQAGVTQIQIQNASAGTISIPSQPYQADGGSTSGVLIYRGDPNGTPDPDPTGSAVAGAGTYLWQYTIPANGTLTLDIADPNPLLRNPVVLCKSVATAPNAVQFVRPVYQGVAEDWQVEVKIISGYYSPINGTETIEGGSGVSQLSGKCVYMRDHKNIPLPNKNYSTLSSNNAFQHS